MKRPVSLQISLAPGDWRLAQHLLPHQVRTWRDQVDEILLTIDLRRSAGRFGADWEAGRDRILDLAASIEGANVLTIDYGAEARARVSAEFFGGAPVPEKDFRGGPYYAYFFGLTAAKHDLVFHVDADIFFGGGSPTWMSEATAYLAAHADVLVLSPLPGPPAANGRLRYLRATPEVGGEHAHSLAEMSTRIFLFDRARFRSTLGALVPRPPPAWRNRVKAWVERNPNADLPEHLFTRQMGELGLRRRDFLGRPPGMWTLHPPYRCADLFAKLPELVRRIERGDVPAEQRGDHDLNSSMVDWTEALDRLRANRWWRRLLVR